MPELLLTHGYFLYEDPKELQIMKPYAPLGILYLCSHLRAKGFDVDVFDTTFSTARFALPPSAHREAVRAGHLCQSDDPQERGRNPAASLAKLAGRPLWAVLSPAPTRRSIWTLEQTSSSSAKANSPCRNCSKRSGPEPLTRVANIAGIAFLDAHGAMHADGAASPDQQSRRPALASS